MSTECPACGDEYDQVGNHWRYNPSHRPGLSEKQKEIITGLMMGDGSLERHGKNPILTVEMIKREYLKHLDQIFGSLSTGVKLKNDAEEIARRSQFSGFKSTSNPDNYSDKYRLRTRSLPELSGWNWYGENGKVWPEDIDMTPTVLKHWYAGDGSLNNNGHRFYAEIHCTNERKNKEKVESYFDGLPFSVSRWRDQERKGSKSHRTSIIFNKSETELMLEYMGEPLPGFEYKWDQ